ncbi:MAG: hypothetical protein ACXVFV_02885 [Mycobacteriales bacterium]
MTPSARTSSRVPLLRQGVVVLILLVGALELVLAAVSWVPHVRLHLIGWAVAPAVLVGPTAAATVVAAQRRGLDLSILGGLPRGLAVPGITAMGLLSASFVLGLLRHEPAGTCAAVYRAGRYALDCHGSTRFTDAAQFFDVRALDLCWTSSVIGYFSVASGLMLRALPSASARTQPALAAPGDVA